VQRRIEFLARGKITMRANRGGDALGGGRLKATSIRLVGETPMISAG
jgi:hypothetical protein